MAIAFLPLFSASRDLIDVLSLLASFVLAIVGIVGIYAALKTLRAVKQQADEMLHQAAIMKEQTQVAEKAAQAALLNAQAIINAERALLLFTVEKERVQGPGGPSIFHINVVNYGKVPARRLEISRPIHATMTLNDFVSLSPPDYGDDLQEIQEWLAPKESWRVATFFPDEKRTEKVMTAQNQGVGLDMIEVIIYGQVTYYDGISTDLRHSRYCLAHDREPFSNIGGSLTPVGSEEYLECT